MESDSEASDGTINQEHELRDALEQQGRELLQLAADRLAAGETAAAQRESKLQRRLQQRATT